MNVFERIITIGSVVGLGSYTVYYTFTGHKTMASKIGTKKINKTKQERLQKTKEELLNTGKIRLLYSTLSF